MTYSLRDAFSDDGNGPDLGILHQFHSRGIDRSGGSEVNDGVNISVLSDGLTDILVDWQQSLARAPVHFAHELTTESVNNTSDGGSGALADEVEVEHALNSSGLQAVDEASRLVVE